MKIRMLLPVIALLSWTASAQTTAIPILNPSFNEDQLACSPGAGCYSPQGITGWLCGPDISIGKFSTVQYPAAPPEGLYAAAIGYTTSTGSMLQTLGDTLQANTTYVLKIKIGARADVPLTGYVAKLMAGNVALASNNTVTPAAGTFETDVIAYNSGANPAQLGKPLQIFVKSLGTGQVDVGGVSLTATPD